MRESLEESLAIDDDLRTHCAAGITHPGGIRVLKATIRPALLASLLLLGLVLVPVPAFGAPGDVGKARVAIAAPDGVPANVELAGTTKQIAAKPPVGTSTTVTLTLPVGAYHVGLPSVTFEGVRYVGQASRPELVVRPGQTSSLDVSYVADQGARKLHATAVSQTSLTLSWAAPQGSRFSLRRTVGSAHATLLSQGVAVPTKGTSAVDQGLRPGTQYSYALFTQDNSRWIGPLAIVASTASPAGSTKATYIASPTTLLAKPTDIASAVTSGTGVELRLRDQVPTPLLGSAVVLPISESLPGGFLGVVTSVSADGRTIGLEAGGLADAFDYYELAVDEFSTGPDQAAIGQSTASSKVTPQAKAAAPQAAAVDNDGCKGAVGATIVFDPSISLGGHFKTTVDKYSILGAEVPVGASLDMGLTAKVTGAAKVKVTGAYSCKKEFLTQTKVLTVSPVPISARLAPSVRFTLGGAAEIDNLGVTASGGVQVTGTMSVKNGASFSGKALVSASPLEHKVAANATVGVNVGGELLVGPGVGTAPGGVVAGVLGELYPIDARWGPYFTAGDSRFNACTKAEVNLTRSLSLAMKAWLGKFRFTEKVTLDVLEASTPYPGSPWFLPNGCKDLPAAEPQDSLLGPGVVKVDDSTVGTSGQWGHVDGFAPGKKTWVLSTGMVSDAIGEPTKFASTGLGGDGDDELTALAGHPTHDAAAYQVTLVPAGSTLHVKYVFASEEYPEFVGSPFNDVMAVRVNGKNCATVPGSTNPVSVNTINDKTNSAYYVDNSTGAAGYSTSMDGLTVPLTCSVPVTFGQPVTVQIAVADTSDDAYDSAVALLDGGIWTD